MYVCVWVIEKDKIKLSKVYEKVPLYYDIGGLKPKISKVRNLKIS